MRILRESLEANTIKRGAPQTSLESPPFPDRGAKDRARSWPRRLLSPTCHLPSHSSG